MPLMIASPLPISDEQRAALEVMARSSSLPYRKVVQSRALLFAADGVAINEVARRCGTSAESVRAWRRRFAEQGVEGVGRIAPGRGRRPWLPEGTVAEVVRVTLEETPEDGSTHWTTRSLAQRFGIGKDTVARIWRNHNLKPWKVDTFKISNDPDFEEKLVDVVGLYMDPPERAVVFSFDEKTQVQALDRTQPSLPLKPGRAGTMTHDYKRNGTTDLFAALNVATGEVIYDTKPRHSAKEVLGFFQADRPPRPPPPRRPCCAGQPVGSQSPGGGQVAGSSQKEAVASPLHPHLFLLAQPGRGVVQTAHRPAAPPRNLHQCRCSHRGHRSVGRALERRPQTLRMAQDRRRHHHQGPPRPNRPHPPNQIRDAPLVADSARFRLRSVNRGSDPTSPPPPSGVRCEFPDIRPRG